MKIKQCSRFLLFFCLSLILCIGCGGSDGDNVGDLTNDGGSQVDEKNQWGLIKTELDSNNDNAIDYTATNSYNTDGKSLRGESYSLSNDEGVIEIKHEIKNMTYDDNGRKITEEVFYDHSLLSDPHQPHYEYNYVHKYSYDSQGDMVKEERWVLPENQLNSTTYYTYDANGNVTSEIGEYETHYYKYNSDGNETKLITDYDNDEIIDDIRTFYYNADGQRVLGEFCYDDVNECSMIFDYDENGFIIEYKFVFDGITTFLYSYDSSPHMTQNVLINRDRWDWNVVNFGGKGFWENYRSPSKIELDHNKDGISDQVINISFNENGLPYKSEQDFDNDEVADAVTYFTYQKI